MDELERKLRESLQARANDVEPTPALWNRVEATITRRSRWHAAVWALAGVAAVVAAAVVVPQVLNNGRTTGPEIGPLNSPTVTEAPPAVARQVPEDAVVLRGTSLDLVTRTGNLVTHLFDVPTEGGFNTSQVAVRPGSTRDDLTVALLGEVEGEYDVRTIHVVNGKTDGFVNQPVARLSALPQQVPGGPSIAWSPDGRFLAWIGAPGPGADAQLRVAAWPSSAGPSDVVSGQPIDARGVDLAHATVQDWVGITSEPGGRSTIELTTDDGTAYAVSLTMDTQASGFVAERTGVTSLNLGDGSTVDLGHAAPDAVGTPDYRLAATDGSFGDEPLTMRQPDGTWVGLAFPPELSGTDPADVWMTSLEGGVLVGGNGQTYLVAADTDRRVSQLGDGVTAADFLPTAGSATATPNPTSAPSPTGGTGPLPAAQVPAAVVVDRAAHQLVVRDASGADVLTLATWAADAEFAPTEVSVQPGSTVAQGQAVVMETGLGMTQLSSVSWSNGSVTGPTPFPKPYQVDTSTAPSPQGVPVFAPDGSGIAWVAPDANAGGFTLNIVGWRDGPGTGDPATDNTSFGLDFGGSVPGRVRAETWTQVDGSHEQILLRAGDTGAGLYAIDLDRQADGAVAMTAGPTSFPVGGGEVGLDVALGGQMVLRRDASGAVDLALVAGAGTSDVRALQPLTLPDWFAPSAPEAAWLVGGTGGAFVGDSSGHVAWISSDGAIAEVGTNIGWAAPLG